MIFLGVFSTSASGGPACACSVPDASSLAAEGTGLLAISLPAKWIVSGQIVDFGKEGGEIPGVL